MMSPVEATLLALAVGCPPHLIDIVVPQIQQRVPPQTLPTMMVGITAQIIGEFGGRPRLSG